ncbi:hypothetical protein CCU22_01980 [Candidatus Legionella polyplacis]|uniref:DUF1820 family protein n=1 Tax=Candidatus Legionella polyplacis TaxID=2005262 RepID=A0ABZ2H039_9GAMM|nr:DUF1820 family protein [Candidatus Legionella polyplacis]ATW01959.1 hypothetical protein CCU22_01980 [Candidatus Legionella polyplacis]
MLKKSLYRITFSNQDVVYEIYASKISESEIFGFIEVEDFIFGETTSFIVDPSEERLKIEFGSVLRTFIPMNSIFRIDEVRKRGVSKVYDRTKNIGKLNVFPIPNKNKE